MEAEFYSIVVGLTGLYIIAGIALLFTVIRQRNNFDQKASRQFTMLLLFGILCQSIHFIEEFLTEFYIRFPSLLGLASWSSEFFITFNLIWIIIWLISIAGINYNIKTAYFPIWFLIFGSIGNGIVHPILSIYTQDYFPGLYTSPLVGIVGIILFSKLIKLTTLKSEELHSSKDELS